MFCQCWPIHYAISKSFNQIKAPKLSIDQHLLIPRTLLSGLGVVLGLTLRTYFVAAQNSLLLPGLPAHRLIQNYWCVCFCENSLMFCDQLYCWKILNLLLFNYFFFIKCMLSQYNWKKECSVSKCQLFCIADWRSET